MSEQTQRFAAAFDEWLRRYQEAPETFAKDYPTDGTYGQNSAEYFESILSELDEAK